MSPKIPEIYTNRTRVRVCGLCWRGEKLLMVNHVGLTEGSFWSPPGGGVEFGETATDALTREFREETGIEVVPKTFQFVCEYIQHPLHAVELFFTADHLAGDVVKGNDPETDPENQLIRDVKYMSLEEILAVPADERHGVFKLVQTVGDLKSLAGFHRI